MEEKQSNFKSVAVVVILAVAIFVIWDVYFLKPMQKKNQLNSQNNVASQGQTQEQRSGNMNVEMTDSNNHTANSVNRKEVLSNKKLRVYIKTDKIKGSISLVGAKIDNITLLKYKQTTSKNSPFVEMLNPKGTKNAYFYVSGFVAGNKSVDMPNYKTVWKTNSHTLTTKSPVILTFKNKQGITFKKIISIDKNYMLFIKDEVINNSKQNIDVYPFAYILRHGEPQVKDTFISHEGGVGYFNNENQQLKYKNIKKDGVESFLGKGGYFGFANKYFMVAVAPSTNYNNKINFKYFADSHNIANYQADYMGSSFNISSKQKYTNTTKLFVGPKEYNLLSDYGEKYDIAKFANSIDFGWFYFITKPFLSILLYIDHLLGSEFAYAMLIFTILIRLIVFPVTYSSYSSMAKMRKIQPQMKQLKEKHAGDNQKYNQAIMALYKKEKVNPLAGCLPLIIQIPILFSIYKVIFIAVEMRQAPFLWIKDLSAADPTSIFNLFGLLPYTVPEFLHIGFWAILMGLTMFVQQKLSNTTFVNEAQKKLMAWFPVILVFVLAKFPAGLLVYWCWSNIISIIQQYIINQIVRKRHGHH